MKKMKFLIAALLVAALLVSACYAAAASMFAAPTFSMGNTGFSQISPKDIGKAPIIFAPSNKALFSGGLLGTHIKPKLMTPTWSSSMKTSGINQMFAMMANGIGAKSKT